MAIGKSGLRKFALGATFIGTSLAVVLLLDNDPVGASDPNNVARYGNWSLTSRIDTVTQSGQMMSREQAIANGLGAFVERVERPESRRCYQPSLRAEEDASYSGSAQIQTDDCEISEQARRGRTYLGTISCRGAGTDTLWLRFERTSTASIVETRRETRIEARPPNAAPFAIMLRSTHVLRRTGDCTQAE